MNIHKAVVAVMREIGAIGKDSENVQQKYKYRSVEQVYNRVQPLFAKHGIFSYPKVVENTRETHQTAKGGTLHYAVLTVEYTFAAEDGSSISITVVGEAMDSGDKASNKAMAAAHKYAICQLLNIPYEIVDPDAYTPEWAAALNASVTLGQLNSLKKRWAASRPDIKDKDKLRQAFLDWVRNLIPDEFDATDFRQWRPEDLKRCEQALEEKPDPSGDSSLDFAQWQRSIGKIESAADVAEFRETILPQCPSALLVKVKEALAARENELGGPT